MNTLQNIIATLNNLSNLSLKNNEEIMKRERKLQEDRRLMYYQQAVPERFARESLDSYKIVDDEKKDALIKVRVFVKAIKCGSFQTLILLGGVGTGKTHLACGVIRECGGLYKLSSGIVEEIRRAKSFTSPETEAKILENYGKARFLVIDEIGRSISTTDEQYMIYQIINERYNRRKPTILISNHQKKEFLQYIGVAASDRLTESAQVLELSGKSYRAVIRQENDV